MDKRMGNQKIAEMIREKMVGRRYQHFKGGIYVVTDIAIHSETAEMIVIYKSFENPALVWARPYDMFVSEVDHEKYPDVKQEYRFQLIENKPMCPLREASEEVQQRYNAIIDEVLAR